MERGEISKTGATRLEATEDTAARIVSEIRELLNLTSDADVIGAVAALRVPHVCDDTCPANAYHYRTGAPLAAQENVRMTIDKRTTGLYDKFRVERTDGKSAPGEKHDGCEYFVLDITHDPHAKAALLAYADSCATDYPKLAVDVRDKARLVGYGTRINERTEP